MLTRMVPICWPRDPPASASQSAGITGVSHRARPFVWFLSGKWWPHWWYSLGALWRKWMMSLGGARWEGTALRGSVFLWGNNWKPLTWDMHAIGSANEILRGEREVEWTLQEQGLWSVLFPDMSQEPRIVTGTYQVLNKYLLIMYMNEHFFHQTYFKYSCQ